MKESIVIPEHLAPQFEKAKEELGEDVFNEKLDVKFGKPVLNFARSMVINLPGDCYAMLVLYRWKFASTSYRLGYVYH